MMLENYLILNKYLLNLLGFSGSKELFQFFKDRGADDASEIDYNNDYLKILLSCPSIKIDTQKILEYDFRINKYVCQLQKGRRSGLKLTYFQYLAVFFTEIFLDNFFNNRQVFLQDINEFRSNKLRSLKNDSSIIYPNEMIRIIGKYSDFDNSLKKVGYWMSTGSGKTIIMHLNYQQIRYYAGGLFDNILLITPNEELSYQHYNELKESNIRCRIYDSSRQLFKMNADEMLIIDIHKLRAEKSGKGVTIDISCFEGRNLVFIDEGHKGQKTDEQTWKKIRESIADKGFIFEYSASFGQVIKNSKDLLYEYSNAILFDYSYKYFYEDGYGKDFFITNLAADKFIGDETDVLITLSLLINYQQQNAFKSDDIFIRKYNIEKPLLAYVGTKVSGKKLSSDILIVLDYLRKLLANKSFFIKCIKLLLKSSLFKSKLITEINLDKILERLVNESNHNKDIISLLFNGTGTLEIYDIIKSDAEIALKVSGAEHYFGVINIGDKPALKRLLRTNNYEIMTDHISSSLFTKINEPGSPINILIGARKFLEGWNCWRLSSMGLLNVGRNEGHQVIQLFGRGVRLKGENFSLKRDINPGIDLKILQSLFITGLNSNYIESFLKLINEENMPLNSEAGFELLQRDLSDKPMKKEKDKSGKTIMLQCFPDKLSKVRIVFRSKIKIFHGFDDQYIPESESLSEISLSEWHLSLINPDEIFMDAVGYKQHIGFPNIIISQDAINSILKSRHYRIYWDAGRNIIQSASDVVFLDLLAKEIIRKYLLILRDGD